jgi:hypothetical protein
VLLNIVTQCLKGEIVELERWLLLGNGCVNMFPWQPSHVTAATVTHATIEEPLEAVFFVGSTLRLYIMRSNWSFEEVRR